MSRRDSGFAEEGARINGLPPFYPIPRKKKRRKRSPAGFLYPAVRPRTPWRKGHPKHVYLDLHVKRRNGPLCETCGRKHYPFQGCWTGPANVKRDRLGERHAEAMAENQRIDREAQIAMLEQLGPAVELGAAPEGLRSVRPPG